MKIGMFFGSFNPIHIGHKVIASYLVDFTDLDKVMFVVSPQNPLKQKISLLDQYHRLQLIRAEVEDNPKLEVSDIEFSMPNPSYTIDTLVRLKENYPEDFSRLIDKTNLSEVLSDNLYPIYSISLNKWYVDELYNNVLVKPFFYLASFFWKKGDINLIDSYGPNGVSRLINLFSRGFSIFQSGYLYHYAFVMLGGLVIILTWFIYY